MSDWLVAGCALFAAGLAQGLAGFGSGLVAVSLLPLVWPVSFAVGVSAVYSLFIAGILAWQLRAHLRAREILVPVVAAICAVPLGAAGLRAVDPALALGCLGAVITAYAAWSLLRTERETSAMPRLWGVAAGLTSGMLTGAFNTGGPPIVAWVGAQTWSKDEMKGTLQIFFIPSSLVAIATYVRSGVVDAETLGWNLRLAPALLGGLWIGAMLYGRVPQKAFRTLLHVGLLLVGAHYLVSAVG
ncbi:MAG: sulfite exporter TauE/SafE family protein [Deltaproteobacteria bacterium]|nr:sulfite exporter TauE/SafE family protein [Deltaproteobacteria bacterium]